MSKAKLVPMVTVIIFSSTLAIGQLRMTRTSISSMPRGTFGEKIPTTNELGNGMNHVWKSTLQYRVVKKLWQEIEFNTTQYKDGEHAGKALNDVTPGIVAGRFKLAKRVGVSIGGGFQIATTQFYRNNHNGIFTVRFPF